MNQHDQMRDALQSALDAMNLHCSMYPHMDKGFMVDAREKAEQTLAAEPAPLVRLTDEQIQPIIESCYEYCPVKDRRFFEPEKFANAIMDAMERVNK